MRDFDYSAPTSLEECISYLAEHSGEARVLAGGTDLLIGMASGKVLPRALISLRKVPGVRGISVGDEGVTIGAATTLAEIESSPIVKRDYSILYQSVAGMSSPQIRNRATLGGNLCNASPAADTAAPLIILGAQVAIRSSSGERLMLVEEFFQGPGATALGPGELLVAVRIPRPKSGTAARYIKLGRTTAMDIAVVAVAVSLVRERGMVVKARIALSAVAPRPIRVPEAEAVLIGSPPTMEAIEQASILAASAARPISDVRASREYRREMACVLTRRALVELLDEVKDGSDRDEGGAQ